MKTAKKERVAGMAAAKQTLKYGIPKNSAIMKAPAPIMGAGAFIMAEFLGIPYFKVCLAAAIPATLSFFAVFMQVHYRAVQLGIKGIPKSELPSLKGTLIQGWHHLL